MPVDPKVLEQCIVEQAGEDAEMADFLRKKYAASPDAASRFVAGFMPMSDYTQKTQTLADERKKFEQSSGNLSSQLETTRKALEAADTEKAQILKELADRRVSVAKASELMKMLKEKYNLTDDDLPGMSDLIETRKTGQPTDSTPDLDTRFQQFGDDLMKRMEKRFVEGMAPELGSMAVIPLIWDEINREHEELTGKKLTFSEKQEIYKLAKEGQDSSLGKGSIMGIWMDKYKIGGEDGLRMQKRDERLKAQWQSDREKADADRRQKDALEQVTPKPVDLGQSAGISLAFRQKDGIQGRDHYHPPVDGQFRTDEHGTSLVVNPGQHPRPAGGRVPAAQRAAQKFVESRMPKSA